jgi:hypothetical protein
MLSYLTDAPPGIVLESIYDEFPRDTGIYGSFAQKPNLVGLPYVLEVWKKNLPELPPLVAKIESFYAGTLLDAARFLSDHDVRYVVWSVRESKDIDAWRASCRRSTPTTAGWSFPQRPRRISASGSAADGRATASSLSPGRDIN